MCVCVCVGGGGGGGGGGGVPLLGESVEVHLDSIRLLFVSIGNRTPGSW